MKIALLSNHTIDLLVRYLPKEHSYYVPPGYDTWIGELLAAESGLETFAPELVFLLLDGRTLLKKCRSKEEGTATLDQLLSYVERLLKSYPRAGIFVSTLDIPSCSIRPMNAPGYEKSLELHWSDRLRCLSNQFDNLLFFDLKELVEQIGRERFYSAKLWYLGGTAYSMFGTRQLVRTMRLLIDTFRGRRKKCLVLDLDNTLWGGVLGEDGLEGVQLAECGEGERYYDFQCRLQELKETGVLLTIASKNNDADVREMLRNHPFMVLRENDFAVIKANWNHKSQSIREIAEELNINTDSFVFVDDNPLEREEVRRMLPEVVVVDFPEPELLEELAGKLFREYFYTFRVTGEDAQKTLQYFQESRRKKALAEAETFVDYLQSLDICIDIHSAKPEEIVRVAQLTQKTNQFNLTTRRYTTGDIAERLSNPDWRIYTVHTRDRFGENGLVCVLILYRDRRVEHGENTVGIDTFLMSCRIMGRQVEDAVMETIENLLRREGILRIRAEYLPTSKNLPVAGLFERLGYSVIDSFDDGRKRYCLDLSEEKPQRFFCATINVGGEPFLTPVAEEERSKWSDDFTRHGSKHPELVDI